MWRSKYLSSGDKHTSVSSSGLYIMADGPIFSFAHPISGSFLTTSTLVFVNKHNSIYNDA